MYCNDLPNPVWWKDGIMFLGGDRVSQLLKLSNLQEKDSGWYSCTAKIDVVNQITRYYLAVGSKI